MTNTRQAFHVTVRRLATGADYSAVRFLRSESDAFESMATKVRYAEGIKRDALRLVACRPATESEVAAHRARLAAI